MNMKHTHTGWTIAFWVVAIILGIHYFFIYLPHSMNKGTFSIGSFIIPIVILVVLWQFKIRADKNLNKGQSNSEAVQDNPQKERNKKISAGPVLGDDIHVINHTAKQKMTTNRFSIEQQAVMVWFLVKIAEADGDININEEQQLGQFFQIIGYDLSDKETESISRKVAAYSLDQLTQVLNSLEKSDKEIFAITTYSLIVSDGQPKEDEIKMALYSCTQIGIDDDEYYRLIKKSATMYNQFKG